MIKPGALAHSTSRTTASSSSTGSLALAIGKPSARYASLMNANCPNCHGNKAREWKRKALAQLLPCSYFMLTFTVPEALRGFIRSHPKECYRALLNSSLDALVKLAKDPKFIGSEVHRIREDRSDGRTTYLGSRPLLEPSCPCAGARRSYLEGQKAVATESK